MRKVCYKVQRERLLKRGGRVWSVIAVWVITGVLLLYNWIAETIPLAHISPQVEKINIEPLIRQKETDATQLLILSRQTGLHPDVIGDLLEQGDGQQLFQIQQSYFAPVLVESLNTTFLTVSELLLDANGQRTEGMPIVDIRDGDILITKNSRFLGWRNGHAGLVVDAEKGFVLEAIMPGTNSKLSKIEKWETYPSFQVLRLKEVYAQQPEGTAKVLPQKVATYALEHMTDVPYQLWAGVPEKILSQKIMTVQASEQDDMELPTIKGTQCAHLVWYAYKQFGINLDSDGGFVVTPYDIQNSDYLEIIQSYGY